MRMILTMTVLLVTAWGVRVDGLEPSTPRIDQATVAAFVEPYIDAERLCGISVGIVDGDSTLTFHTGSLAKDNPTVPDGRTIYEIGSISKVFTSLLLAHVVQSGALELNSNLGDLMPAIAAKNPTISGIELQFLAMHTSGLPRLPTNMNPSEMDPYANYSRDDLKEFLAQYTMQGKPGRLFQYSNLGAGLLGEVLSIEANQSYESLLREVIAEPLEMIDTTITLSDEQRRRFATPHRGGLVLSEPWHFDALAGAGAVRSTTDDMLKLIKANLDPDQTQSLSPALELAWQQRLPSDRNVFAMGLGWHIARDGQTRWHNGQTGGYHAMLMINREMNAGIMVLSNTASQEIDKIAESLLQKLAGMDVPPPRLVKSVMVPEETVFRLSGRYEIAPGFVMTVRSDGEELYARLTGQPELRLYADGPTTWSYRAVQATIDFRLPESGSATSMTLNQNGRQIPGKRIGDVAQ